MREPMPPSRLRAARLMKGWRIIDLAGAVGLRENGLYRIESGRTKAPKLATRRRLAAVLKVKPCLGSRGGDPTLFVESSHGLELRKRMGFVADVNDFGHNAKQMQQPTSFVCAVLRGRVHQ
jgi:transcriptional regulator with XRE-family HTH domain